MTVHFHEEDLKTGAVNPETAIANLINFIEHSEGVNKLFALRDQVGIKSDPTIERARELAAMWPIHLRFAVPYFVTKKIVELMDDGLDQMPIEASLSEAEFPAVSGFVYLEETLELPYGFSGLHELNMRAYAWARYCLREIDDGQQADEFIPLQMESPTDGVILFVFGEMPGGVILLMSVIQMPWGMSIDEVSKKSQTSDLDRRIRITKFIASVGKFAHQKIATVSHVRSSRAVRREFVRKNINGREAPLIQMVDLRVVEKDRSNSVVTADRSLSIRFVRRGHWHKYWCGGGGKRCLDAGHKDRRLEVRWTEPTVCGPKDAPVKSPIKLFKVWR